MINEVIKKIKATHVSISQWILGFTGILFIRFILESLSSPTSTGIIPSDPYTLIHYGLFFLATALGLVCIIGYLSKDYANSGKFLLFGLPTIWLGPIFDIILSGGKGVKLAYISHSHWLLFLDFFKFLSPQFMYGATFGIRLEIVIILFSVGWYIWLIRRKISQALLVAFFSYILIFILATIPGLLYTFSHIYSPASLGPEVSNYLKEILLQSNIFHNTLHEGMSSVSQERFFELGFDKLLSQILFIISVLFGILLFWKINSKKFLVVIKNMRLERIGSYIALLFCGIGFAYLNQLNNSFVWIDVLGIMCLIISWIALWMHAVHVNDLADVEIDKISNVDRPLIKKDLSPENMRDVGNLWLVVALLGSWVAGFYPFFMSMIYVACSYIYSSPPLRLRQFPVIPSFLIGVASLATILAGFFFVSIDKQIQTFPILLAVGIVIMVTLAINVKDMKDIEGDKADGIITLPILFKENGPKIVGLCLALSFLLVPIFLSFYFLYIITIPAAIIGYILVTKKPYAEKPIFILRFVFLAGIAILYLGTYWLGHIYNMI